MVQFMVGRGAAFIACDPGTGKTSCTLAAFKVLKGKGLVRRMLVIAPLRPATSVWPAEAKKWDDFREFKVGVLHGPDKAKTLKSACEICTINPEGLPWLASQPWGEFDMLVVDECFPTGTSVRAKVGPVVMNVCIEDIRPGDKVLTSAGLRSVLESGTRVVDELVRLEMSDGEALECTKDHPVFTDLGWLPASRTAGRRVYTDKNLYPMWGAVPSYELLPEVLREILRTENSLGVVQPGESAENREADVSTLCGEAVMEQGGGLAQRAPRSRIEGRQTSGSDIYSSGWERYGHDQVRSSGSGLLTADLGVEFCRSVGQEAARLSYLLQSGLRAAGCENGTGGRRAEPPSNEARGPRQEKGGGAEEVRVVSVSRVQCQGTKVYNLRVAGCPHYFAGGVLVHNCTRFKHANTQRFKTLKPMLKNFKRRYGLTGSPAPNGLLDLFGQAYILDLGNALGPYITHYRNQYFDASGYGGYTWTLKPGAEERIYERLKPLVLRMDRNDLLELPPLLFNRVEVTLPPEARKLYDQMESLMLAAVGDNLITAANAAAATNKCRQLANGGIYHEDPERWTHVHEAKVDAVEEIIEELGGKPVLVAYEYRHDLERLRRRLGKDTPYIGGGVPTKRFKELEALWNAGRLPVLLAQPVSVAHGLNLQETQADVVFAGQTWDLEVREQFIQRVYRQGQKHRVTVHDIVSVNTVDEVVLRALEKKDKTQRALLDALKEYGRSR
jgi:hypothetical protein